MQKDETETPQVSKRLDLDNLLENLRTNLKTKLQLTPADLERLDKIQKSSHTLDDNVNQLEKTIKGILDKQYDEYVKTFEQFMDSVRKELREKIEAMEQEEKKRQKMNDIRIIKCERDFFRLEAIRLNGLCKDMSSKIEEMAFRMKLMSNELNSMTTKWKESENVNKQLLVELESNLQTMKDVEKENNEIKEKMTKITLDNLNSHNTNTNDDQNAFDNNLNSNNGMDLESNSNYETIKKEKLLYIIEKLKCDLKKERMRNHKTLSEFNKMILDKNKLESIFGDCVEEVRKDIFNRKLKETINENYAINRKNKNENTTVNIPYVSDIKYDKFLPSDKRKIMEMFILKDEVAGVIQDLVFNKPKNEVDNILNMQGVNILNENRIHSPPTIKNGTMTNDNFGFQGNTKNTFFKSKFNFTNSFGKKTHLNFGTGGRLKGMKTSTIF